MGKYDGNHSEAFLKRAEDEAHRGNKALNNIIKNDSAAKDLEAWRMSEPTAHYKHVVILIFLSPSDQDLRTIFRFFCKKEHLKDRFFSLQNFE